MATRHPVPRRPSVTIAVLGSANMDLVVRQPRLARPGETLFGSSFTAVPGGKGLNQAVAAARAGGRVRFAGAVGDDQFGAALRARLAADGIDTAALATVGAPTGVAAVSVVDGGENSIVVVPGANHAVAALDDATRDLIARSGLLVTQFERPLGLVGEALAAARASGVTTVLTPAPVLPAPADLLELVDILVPNATEACELAGTDDETAAARALSRTAGTVVMTRGPRGVLVARGGAVLTEVPARQVEAVDTTAAGDTLAGVMASVLAAGQGLERAVRVAVTAASIAVTRPGASISMPTRAEIAALL